jgi:hypothetical protein
MDNATTWADYIRRNHPYAAELADDYLESMSDGTGPLPGKDTQDELINALELRIQQQADALEFYAAEARAIANNWTNQEGRTALQASMIVLRNDAGRKADL